MSAELFFFYLSQELCPMKLFSDWPNATNKRAWRYTFDAETGVKAISCHAVVNEHAGSLDHITDVGATSACQIIVTSSWL